MAVCAACGQEAPDFGPRCPRCGASLRAARELVQSLGPDRSSPHWRVIVALVAIPLALVLGIIFFFHETPAADVGMTPLPPGPPQRAPKQDIYVPDMPAGKQSGSRAQPSPLGAPHTGVHR
jgi:hypothetical protein